MEGGVCLAILELLKSFPTALKGVLRCRTLLSKVLIGVPCLLKLLLPLVADLRRTKPQTPQILGGI